MSFWSSLAGIAGKAIKFAPIPGAGHIGDALGAAGSALGGMSQQSAANRDAKLAAQMDIEAANRARANDYFGQQVAKDQLSMEGLKAARRDAAIGDYVAAGGNTKATGLPAFDLGRRAPGAAEIEAARQLGELAKARIAAGGTSVQAQDRGTYAPEGLNPSGFEKFAGLAAPILGGIGGVMNAKNDPLASLRAEHPDLSESQLRTIAAVLKEKGVRF